MNIAILTGNRDILAVATVHDGPSDELVRAWSAGATNGRLPFFGPLLTKAIDTFRVSTEPGHTPLGHIRVAVGGWTIVVQREHGYIIAVCIPTGHAVAKSLHRMIRRAAKPARGKKEVDGG